MAWLSILQLLTIPLYLKILGNEAWGLLSIVLIIYAFVAIIGSGMSQVLPREISIRNSANSKVLLWDISFGFERVFWVVGLIFAVVILLLGDALVARWINLESIAYEDARMAFQLLALQLIIQWPVACYHGFLLGLNEHAKLNKMQVFFATIKHVACVLSLIFIESSVFVYQVVFLIVSAAETLFARRVSWSILGADKNSCKWNATEMKKVLGFVSGMTFTVLIGGVLVQADKLLLSGLLPVSDFGFYSVASVLSMALLQAVYPMTRSVYPILSVLIDKNASLVAINEKLIKILMATLLPAAVFIAVFSSEVLHLWTGNIELVDKVSLVLSLLVAGTLMNGIYNIPYTLYIASGNSRVPLIINMVSLLCIVVSLPVLFDKFGIQGAASSWLLVNFIAAIIGWKWIFSKRYAQKRSLLSFVFVGVLMVSFALVVKKLVLGLAGMLIVAFVFAAFSSYTIYLINKNIDN
ncbi:MAG: oligosaccharide flippase family protein [Bacteroidota bacterium]